MLIYDSETGSLYKLKETVDELRQAAADALNPMIATHDGEWGDFLYEMGWNLFEESDAVAMTPKDILPS